jgi:LPS export ABC transporter protein LptC
MNKLIARIAFVFFCITLAACENDMEAIMNMDKKTAAVEEGKDIESIYSQTGRVKAKLTAPLMYRHLQPPVYVEFSKGLKVLFYNDSLPAGDSMAVESTLTARYGKYFENDANIFLRDHVVVINKKGERLDCDELNWDSKKQIFYSNKPVRISTETDTLYGKGLESNQDFSDYTILNPSGPFILRDSTSMQ